VLTIHLAIANYSARDITLVLGLGWPVPEPKRVGLIQFEIKAEHSWRRVRRVARGLGIEANLLDETWIAQRDD